MLKKWWIHWFGGAQLLDRLWWCCSYWRKVLHYHHNQISHFETLPAFLVILPLVVKCQYVTRLRTDVQLLNVCNNHQYNSPSYILFLQLSYSFLTIFRHISKVFNTIEITFQIIRCPAVDFLQFSLIFECVATHIRKWIGTYSSVNWRWFGSESTQIHLWIGVNSTVNQHWWTFFDSLLNLRQFTVESASIYCPIAQSERKRISTVLRKKHSKGTI